MRERGDDDLHVSDDGKIVNVNFTGGMFDNEIVIVIVIREDPSISQEGNVVMVGGIIRYDDIAGMTDVKSM